jgi:hypothetical protein
MNTKPTARKHLLLAAALAIVSLVHVRADDTYETLKVGTNVLKNVRVVQASPVEIVVGHDEGYQRIRLQDLPPELKAKYPYDPGKAAEYEKQRAETAANLAARGAAARRTGLLQKEQELKGEIAALKTEMERLNADINVQSKIAKGKKAKPAARRQLDAMRKKKMDLQDRISKTEETLATFKQELK